MENNGYTEVLRYIVDHLVEFPDEIVIREVENDDVITVQLKVAPSDMGKVIGRQGRIAKEIRTLVKAAGLRENRRLMVDIID